MVRSKTFELTRQLAAALPEASRTPEALGNLLLTMMAEAPAEWLRPLTPHEAADMLGISTDAIKLRRFRGMADHPPLWEETLAPDGTPRKAPQGRRLLYCDRLTLLRWIAGEEVRLAGRKAS